MTFKQLVDVAMEAQRLGHSVPFAASLVQVWHHVPISEAHLISRAAEVYLRILRRERAIVRWL